MKRLFVLACFLFGLPLLAQTTKPVVNVDKQGVAVQGYDPVAFFTQNKPTKGDPKFQSTYKGAIYFFASAEDKAMFDSNPAKYEPQFGGFCAYGVAKGHAVPIKVEAFQIVNGRLLLQYDLGVKDDFNKDQAGNLAKADKNWPAVAEKLSK